MNPTKVLLALAIVLFTTNCGDGELSIQYPTVGPDNLQTVASALRPSERRARAELIRDAARARGLTNGALLAGIADVETNMAQCWDEARWACKGPASSSCDGGPVIAGSADGPCSSRQGGLGMFQFDAGTYDQTLAREGRGILTIEGNTQAAIDFVTNKVRISEFMIGIDTNAQALEWMNNLRPGTMEWDQWMRTITGYYNGCFKGHCRKYASQYNKYDSHTRAVLTEFGPDFWGAASAGTSSSAPVAETGGSASAVGIPSVATELSPADAQVANGNSLAMQWVSVGATRYEIRVEYFVDGQWRHYWDWKRNAAVFEVWPQVSNSAYRWTIKACNANGCADWSDYANFTYGTATAPGGQSTVDTTNTGTTTADTGTSTTPATSSNTGTSNSPADTTTEEDTSSAASTPPPQQSSGVPGMAASMSPAGVYIETASVPLSWSEPPGAETSDIVMYYFDDGAWVDYYVWENKTGGQFTVWPVVNDTYYAWAIRSCNGMGCSDWSDFQQFYFGP